MIPSQIRPYARLTATSLKTEHLKRHVRSKFHKLAAKRQFADAVAPKCADFLKVLHLVTRHAGSVGADGISEVGGKMKVNKMVIALAEAMYQKDRSAISKAMTVTILRDVRKSMCAIRFVSVDRYLKQHSGLLGAATHLARFGHGGEGLLNTSDHLFKQFATVAVPGGQFNDNVYNRLRHRCHIVCVDAAGDEVLASELGRLPVSDVFGVLTPQLQCVLRDKAHASRRTWVMGGGGRCRVASGGGRATPSTVCPLLSS